MFIGHASIFDNTKFGNSFSIELLFFLYFCNIDNAPSDNAHYEI